MTLNAEQVAKVTSPAYWDNFDVLGKDLPRRRIGQDIWLYSKDYKKAKNALELGALSLAAGKYQEVIYSEGTNFNPSSDQLPNGSIVILSHESIFGNLNEKIGINTEQTPPLYEPVIEYWTDNLATVHNGFNRNPIPEHKISYDQYLRWGVIGTDHRGSRVLQTFDFKYLLPNEDADFSYRGGVGALKRLPIEPGEVTVSWGRYSIGILRLVSRIKKIHVLHIDNKDKPNTSQHRRRIKKYGRLVVPQATGA